MSTQRVRVPDVRVLMVMNVHACAKGRRNRAVFLQLDAGSRRDDTHIVHRLYGQKRPAGTCDVARCLGHPLPALTACNDTQGQRQAADKHYHLPPFRLSPDTRITPARTQLGTRMHPRVLT